MTDLFRIHDLALRTRVLGPGERTAIWFQGCKRSCPGCMSASSRPLDGGKQASIVIRVIAAPQLGDINADGYADAADAMITLQVAVGKVELNDVQFEAADVNHDGWVDAADAVRILRFDAGLIDSLN